MNRSPAEEPPMPGPGEASISIATIHAEGLTCGVLEPLIAKSRRALAPGQVLEITSDRKEAAGGIRSWLGLTGNTLVKVEEDAESGYAKYFVQKNTRQE